jgi:hypothetical protein
MRQVSIGAILGVLALTLGERRRSGSEAIGGTS